MNPSIKSLFNTCLLLGLFLSFNATAQEGIFQIDRAITFKGSTSPEIININIDKNTKSLDLSIIGRIHQGSLKVEIYDPNGEKRGNFSIEGEMDPDPSKKETVQGRISQAIHDPEQGKWIIKIIPINAHGEILIKSNQQLQ